MFPGRLIMLAPNLARPRPLRQMIRPDPLVVCPDFRFDRYSIVGVDKYDLGLVIVRLITYCSAVVGRS